MSKPSESSKPTEGNITIDGVTVEPIRLTVSDRGFRHAEFRDGFGGTGFLAESSRDGEPGIWLGVAPDLLWLARAHVAALLPHLQRFVERGDLGGEDAGMVTKGEFHGND